MKTEPPSSYQVSVFETGQMNDIVQAWQSKSVQKILFVCTANYQRSKTCEDLFKAFTEVSVSSAGVSRKECARRGSTLCTESMLEAADVIYIFEPLHAERINSHTDYRYAGKLVSLDIPDQYQYMSSDLVELILSRLSRLLLSSSE